MDHNRLMPKHTVCDYTHLYFAFFPFCAGKTLKMKKK